MITKTKISFLAIASVLFISSCKIKDKTYQASDAVVPATFAGRADSIASARAIRQQADQIADRLLGTGGRQEVVHLLHNAKKNESSSGWSCTGVQG
jgi:hypothetical protein